jgi:hypothetical protein
MHTRRCVFRRAADRIYRSTFQLVTEMSPASLVIFHYHENISSSRIRLVILILQATMGDVFNAFENTLIVFFDTTQVVLESSQTQLANTD